MAKAILSAGAGATVSKVKCLEAGLVDQIHLAISPVVPGRGEAMFDGIDLPSPGFAVIERQATDATLHVVLAK